MFGRKKQNHVAAPFFARIEQSDLALDDAVIQDIAERSGVRERWPNVSLHGLQKFTTALVNDVVRAGGHDIRLGNVVYFTTSEKGSASPTGLSWENATLNAGFENIVVSTAEHIFNDTGIRQEEDMTYAIIIEALQPLMDAIIADGTLTQDDLPVLPTEQEFRQARETGEVLTVEPNKFQRSKLESVTPVVEAIEATNDEQLLTETDSSSSMKAPITDSFSKESHRPSSEKSAADNLLEAPTEPTTVPKASEEDSIQRLIDRVNLAPKSFEITDVSPDLPAEDPNYVFSRLNADKAKANDFLNETSNIYTQKIRKAMADLLKQQQSKIKASIAKLRETDVSDTVAAQMNAERASEYESRYTLAHQAREAGYRATVADEEARHEDTLKSLKNTFVSDLEALKVSVNQELDNWFIERSKELHGNLQATVDNQVTEVREQSQVESVTSLKALRDELLAQNSQSLVEMQQKLAADINGKRAQYQEEHEKALISATQLEGAKTHSGNLSELEQQVQVLKQTNSDLEKQLKQKDSLSDNELAQLRQQVRALQDAAKTSANDETSQKLMTLLAAQMKQPAREPKGPSSWQAALVGILAALAIGGAGLGGYVLAQHKIDAAAAASKAVSTKNHKGDNARVTLAPESTATSTAAVSSSASSGSSTTNSPASSSSTLADRYHVGEDVEATINGKLVTAKVVSIQDHAITVHHDGYDYAVPMTN